AGNVTFGYATEGLTRIFIAFDESQNHPQPAFEGLIGNQNLHAIDRADFLIIYYSAFEEAAEKLADHRRTNDNMIVVTADIDQIYNEFGGGKKEPTALRDFVRMLYTRDSNFQYLLLMGDASYDFRGIDQNIPYENFVPTFETLESLDPIEGFPSDDFFALLSPNEGEESLNGALDIGVGRIPCKTASEAEAVVNKIIHYDTSPACFGEWRQSIGFAADDQDIPVDKVHVIQSDGIAKIVDANHPEFNQQKIFFDAFSQESTPGGQRYPDANAAINDNINKGMLSLGYLGHGGPKGWAQERVLQINDVLSWNSYNNLPILITATCSFTGFDEPTFVSAGEHALLNPNGGVIALFTTVRAVYSSSNRRLTEEVFKKIFSRNDGRRLRLGDIVKESQNANSADTTRSNSRKFMLIGDPSLTIAMPEHKVVVDAFNEIAVDPDRLDTLGALDRAIIEGRIISAIDSSDLSNFDGEIFLTVYDKEAERRTLDNDGVGSTYAFDIRNSILYKGSASVTNGAFKIEFILPKDINFDYGKAKLSFYATDNATTDAGGYYDNFIVGGISDNLVNDNTGPDIQIFMDDRSFIFGDRTSRNPVMIVDLEDENGINLSSTSIGHDITAYLDDRSASPLILNEFFTPTIDQLGAGTVEYQFQNLELGIHNVYVKAWDILNNSNEVMTEFFVSEDDEGFVKNLINYPNPFNNLTTFAFEHDLNSSNIDVAISIYALNGVLVKTINEQKFSSGGKIDDIIWDGRDENRNLLPNGIYIYKIKLTTSEFNQQRESDFQKLVILN
ncbi:MAG: type IX secretion system sortase PorU, partial [Saprospiraceae bacterium]|nr:type IX secretion system sortase PorU [Saprospiraceae bacterium]